MQTAVFYILAAVILAFSFLCVTSRRILRAAVYLLFVLIATAGMYFMLGYNFLAAVQLTVYAGGIVVLVIFSILLTHQIQSRLEMASVRRHILGGTIAFAGALLAISCIISFPFQTKGVSEEPHSVTQVGRQLMSYGENGYVLPFELISVLLLAAMVGAIIIAKRKPRHD